MDIGIIGVVNKKLSKMEALIILERVYKIIDSGLKQISLNTPVQCNEVDGITDKIIVGPYMLIPEEIIRNITLSLYDKERYSTLPHSV